MSDLTNRARAFLKDTGHRDKAKVLALIAIAEALERLVEMGGYTAALEAWKRGEGRHPDD